jgi:hypothetical protein
VTSQNTKRVSVAASLSAPPPEDSVKEAKVVATISRGIYKLADGSYRVVAHVGNSRLTQRRKETLRRRIRHSRDEAMAGEHPRQRSRAKDFESAVTR